MYGLLNQQPIEKKQKTQEFIIFDKIATIQK